MQRTWIVCRKPLPFAPKNCTLCPRQCHADRASGRVGFCGAGGTLKAARAALHFWEEPCISGTRGSGTVFFSGCTLKCCFCQNYPISAEGLGKEITVEHLAQIFLDLQAQGAHNINLVTPGQWQPWILAALDEARAKGLHLPIVCNTGGYETLDSIERWRGVHRYLAGRPEICFLFPLGGAFRCTGLFRGGESGH